jgi:putative flippase GtrA
MTLPTEPAITTDRLGTIWRTFTHGSAPEIIMRLGPRGRSSDWRPAASAPGGDCTLTRVSSQVVTAARVGRIWQALRVRFARLVQEVGKFGVVGAICYGIDVAVFNLCRVALQTDVFVALLVSTVVSTTCAFVGNRFWTWRDRERRSLRREYTLYFGFNLVGLGIGAAVLFVSHNVLGGTWPIFQTALADNISAKFVGVGLASLFRFWSYRRFIFRPVPSEA